MENTSATEVVTLGVDTEQWRFGVMCRRLGPRSRANAACSAPLRTTPARRSRRSAKPRGSACPRLAAEPSARAERGYGTVRGCTSGTRDPRRCAGRCTRAGSRSACRSGCRDAGAGPRGESTRPAEGSRRRRRPHGHGRPHLAPRLRRNSAGCFVSPHFRHVFTVFSPFFSRVHGAGVTPLR
jgi:hypothetical protein